MTVVYEPRGTAYSRMGQRGPKAKTIWPGHADCGAATVEFVKAGAVIDTYSRFVTSGAFSVGTSIFTNQFIDARVSQWPLDLPVSCPECRRRSTVDHRVPIRQAPRLRQAPGNLIASCCRCNGARGGGGRRSAFEP